MITHWDVLIQSTSASGLSLALKLKKANVKVAWLVPSLIGPENLFPVGEDFPYFLGLFSETINPEDFELLQEMFYLYQNPFGFSLITPWGPIDYGHSQGLEWLQYKTGFSETQRWRWMGKIIHNLYMNQWRVFSHHEFENNKVYQSSFLTLRPKPVHLIELLNKFNIPILKKTDFSKHDKRRILFDGYETKYLVRIINDFVMEEKFLWKWVKIKFQSSLWSRIFLPFQTLWWDERLVLPYGNSFFILFKDPIESDFFEIYLRLNSSFFNQESNHEIIELVMKELKSRVPSFKADFIDFLELNYEVSLNKTFLNFYNKRTTIDYHMRQANSWSLSDLFLSEQRVFDWLWSNLNQI